MKKVIFALVLFMAVITVNAQEVKTSVTKAKTVRATVELADLQKAITDNIAKDYIGFTVKEAASLTTDKVVTYEVVVFKGTLLETLLYDKDGVFLSKKPPTPVKE
jgi:CRISPR/Cas system type I-B associated protein Csh2 (Cas7 group RAMP superfamily)